MVRIPGFHPGDPGSIPGRGTVKIFSGYEAMAQLAARRIPDPKVGGSTPSSFIRRIYIFFFSSLHVCIIYADTANDTRLFLYASNNNWRAWSSWL